MSGRNHPAELIPLHTLFGAPDRTNPRLSPDGATVSFVAPVDDVPNICAGPSDGDDFQPVSHATGTGIQHYFWAGHSGQVLYLTDSDGDENWHLYGLQLDSGRVTPYTPFPQCQARVLALSALNPFRLVVGLNLDNPALHDPYQLDLRTGDLSKVADNPGFYTWLVDRASSVRGGIKARRDGGADYFLRDEAGVWNLAHSVEPDDHLIGVTAPLGFDATGEEFFMISPEGGDTAQLVALDWRTGTRKVLAVHDDYDVVAASFHPTTFRPDIVTIAGPRSANLFLDERMQEDHKIVRDLHDGDFTVVDRDTSDRRWLVAFTGDTSPAHYYLYDRPSGEARSLFATHSALAGYELAPMEPFSFEARDGLRLHGYLTFPPGADRRDLPAVVHVHGGPWGNRHAWGFSPVSQWLANRGYVCIEVNYRGSSGFGKRFVNASAGEWGGLMSTDLVDAADWVAGRGWVDRKRVAIMGGSYGGYAALAGAAFTPDSYRCAVDMVGPANLITFLESLPDYWLLEKSQFDRFLGRPDVDRDFLWSRSPLARVADIKIPILIAQGANDPRVKQAESEQMVAALRERGVEHEYLLFPDEGHGFARPENRYRFCQRVEHFLAKHIGGRVGPT